MTDDTEALSEYEIQRLERIKRNRQKLAELGLLSAASDLKTEALEDKQRGKTESTAAQKAKARKRKRQERDKRERAKALAAMPRRRSKRQKGEAPEVVVATEATSELFEEPKIQTFLPREPKDLDDGEFLCYTALKKHRLKTARELEIEPYKVCQNRCLVELVRLRPKDLTEMLNVCK